MKKSRLGIIRTVQIASENNIDRYFQKRKIQPDHNAAGQWLRFIKNTR